MAFKKLKVHPFQSFGFRCQPAPLRSGVLLANLASAEAESMFNEWVQQTARVLKEGKLTHGGMWLSKKFYSGDEDVLNNLVLHAPALVADYKRAGGRKPDMARRRCRSIWVETTFV